MVAFGQWVWPLSARADISVARTRSALRSIQSESQISAAVTGVARQALSRFSGAGLKPDDLAIALIVDDEPRPLIGGYNFNRPFYPASVVKLAYALALEKDFASGRLPRDAGSLDDLRDMLALSSNAATNRILDRLTDTQSGPDLTPDQLREFSTKRKAVNLYLREIGLSGINACQKTWDVEPYGRDTQFIGKDYENRNSMTARETARLLWLISNRKVVSESACDEILAHIRRRPGNPKDIQARRIGSGIPHGSLLWSKAGWTGETNHDAAFVDMPLGRPFVLVIFTNTSWRYGDIISWIAGRISSGIRLDTLPPKSTKAQPGRPDAGPGGAP